MVRSIQAGSLSSQYAVCFELFGRLKELNCCLNGVKSLGLELSIFGILVMIGPILASAQVDKARDASSV